MAKVVYQSPVFSSSPSLIPAEALSTYAKRDQCLLQIIALGGIHAKPSAELYKLRSKMQAARRKIERNRWWSEFAPVQGQKTVTV
jgi:hypothetical protein